MKVNIVVPQVGEAVSEVTLIRWFKEAGDEIKAGEPLFLLGTDKAEMDVEAVEDGVLSEIRVPGDSSVMPLDVVGVLQVADR